MANTTNFKFKLIDFDKKPTVKGGFAESSIHRASNEDPDTEPESDTVSVKDTFPDSEDSLDESEEDPKSEEEPTYEE